MAAQMKAVATSGNLPLMAAQVKAVALVVGQTMIAANDVSAEVRGLEEAVAAGGQYVGNTERWLEAKQAELEAIERENAAHLSSLEGLRTEFGAAAMPLAKKGERAYSAAFKSAADAPGGADGLASIQATLEAVKATFPPKPADASVKAARQPSDRTISELQQDGVAEASTLYLLAMAALVASGLADDLSSKSSVATVEKDAGRAFEKAFRRWGGDIR